MTTSETTVLALDTSTRTSSVAVVRGDDVLAESDRDTRAHSEGLITQIEAALAAAGIALGSLDGIAVGVGPGSFTGLRIGLATAKGLCFAAELPMYAVSSLAAIARDMAVGDRALRVPVIDARRSEVFCGFYRGRDGSLESIAPERVLAPADLPDAVAKVAAQSGATEIVLAGDGARLYPSEAEAAGELLEGARATPAAAAIARLAIAAGNTADAATVAPVYIRLSEAEIKYPDGNAGSFKPNP